ncbi:MAG: 1-deoxy-D-xylulose-5-phosphate reductoisomerase, partial [Gemmatimonadaceae bacterium]|nr:1-deoxy-D-xylulose-5-phosphate reductoisomerase [Gemmatimonadaceae bacterium]
PCRGIDWGVHPQSLNPPFGGLVGASVPAQTGFPSRGPPILYALTWPERVPDSGVPSYDPVAQGALTFEAVRHDAFPMLQLGIEAGRRGGAAPAVYNAANEAAVARFLDGRLRFAGIARCVASALEALADRPGHTLDDLQAADQAARLHVQDHPGE